MWIKRLEYRHIDSETRIQTCGFGKNVVATDPDGSDVVFGDLRYSIISGDAASQFYIDVSTGHVITTKKLDYETHQSYALVIQAKERGGINSATTTLTVTINDLNDELPKCTFQTFAMTIPEDKPVGFSVTTLVCADLDATPSLTYTITPPGDTSLFEMAANVLKLKSQLNFETAQSHDLEITVSDSVPSHVVKITGTVTVGSVDEGPPVFQSEPYTASVREDQSVGSVIFTVTAQDPDSPLDANGQVKYSFTATYSKFTIDQSNGEITLVQTLDRENTQSYLLIVKAEDASASDTSTVTVSILDVNDNAPKFTLSSYSASKPEPVAASTSFLTVSASDADDPNTNNYGTVTYAISPSSDFAIHSTTGVITNLNALSADSGTTSYVLYITATDSGGLAGALTESAVVTITITSVNSNDPVCSSPAPVTINENQFSIGDIIAYQSITDADAGADGDVTLSFETPQTKFSLTQTGKVGEIRLAQNLDFDAGDTVFHFNIKVLDQGSPARSTTCTVTVTVNDVNDNPPICTSIVHVQQTEGGTSIATLSCSDVDTGSVLAYTVVSTTPNSISPAVSTTGVVTAGSNLDFETGSSYKIIIKVTDGGSPVRSTSVTVNLLITDLNDNDPTLSGPFTFTVAESQTASSTVLYTASASSNDGPTDTLTYWLSDTTYFGISSTTGEITLTTNAPDYESVTSPYTMDLCVKDSPNPSSRTVCQAMTITITDVNDHTPVFSPSTYSASASESASVGTTVLTVTATDSDRTPAFNTVTYSIFSGNTAAGTQQVFGGRCSETLSHLQREHSRCLEVGVLKHISSSAGTQQVFGGRCSETYLIFSGNTAGVWRCLEVGILKHISSSAGTQQVFGGRCSETLSHLQREHSRCLEVGVLKHISSSAGTQQVFGGRCSEPYLIFNRNMDDFTLLYRLVRVQVAAVDQDHGNDGVLVYSISTGPFMIDSSSGEIRVSGTLDRETLSSYTLTILAADKGSTPKTGTLSLTVSISDVNDNTPSCVPSTYAASITESSSGGTNIATLVCSDADLDPSNLNNALTYSIASGGTTLFVVDTSGAVKVNSGATFDRETTASYTLTINVVDKATTGKLTSTATVSITISDVNDNAPTFTSLPSPSVPENTAVGNTITTVVASDLDIGINSKCPMSCVSKLFSSMDLLAHQMPNTITTVVASDLDIGINSKCPMSCVSKLFSSMDLLAHQMPNTITTVVASDLDIGININCSTQWTYWLIKSPNTITTVVTSDLDIGINNIGINSKCPMSCVSKLFSSMDLMAHQMPNTITTVVASDLDIGINNIGINSKCPMSCVSKLFSSMDLLAHQMPNTITTAVASDLDIGINSKCPMSCVSKLFSSMDLLAHQMPNTITTAVASDLDIGINKQLSYYITSGNGAGKFFIDPSAGSVTLLASLDFETTTSYSLEITVRDQGSPVLSVTGTMTVTVTDVNDKPPVCASSLYTGTVAENSQSTSVVTVSCSDTETVGTVAYSITSGDTNSDFSINSATGVITTSASASIDYETKQNFMLEVTASDGVNSEKTYVKVTVTDVNEADPQFSPAGPYTLTVSESEAIGFTVKTVSATDADTFDSVKVYSITSGDTTSRFMMDATSGVIKIQGLLDHETTPTYTLTIKVSDSGGKFSTTTLTINVGDVNDNSPVCSPTSAAVAVDEGVISGTLYTPACSDLDTVATPTLKYSIVSGSHSSISIDTATGALSLVGSLDYETATSHNLVIQVSDQGTPTPNTCTVSVVITVNPVNEYPPVFTSATYGPYSIPENTALDTSVAQVTATDADLGLLQGTVRYYIISGDSQQQFAIDQSTGKIKVVKSLDREAISTYVLTVRAKDDDPASANEKTADAVVQIDITDVNDKTPVFNPTLYTVDVVESASYGPAVILKTFTVNDDDLGVNSATTITIISGNSENKFSISGNNLILSAQLDYETTTSYELVLKVVDGGTSSLNSAGRVLINVLPFNEMAPLMTQASATKTIPESTSVGTLVYDADASDIDAGVDGQIIYSIASGIANNEFVIDASTGQLFVGSQLDYDTTPNTYAIIIKATDGAGLSDASTSTTSLSIILSDVNDNYPQYSLTMFIFNINENVAVGTSMGKVVVTDKDVGINGVVTLSKVGGSGINYFDIDATTGDVTTKANINYEAFT
ncbi:hypothetical protein Btru_052572, partial [Bulinus truncatus]